jgi:hypothetical protein
MKNFQQWLLLYAQWFTLALLTVLAIVNSATDHGVYMAINCICIGFVAMSLLASRFLALMAEQVTTQRAMMDAMAEQFGRAIREGRIEFVPIVPDDDSDQTTLH